VADVGRARLYEALGAVEVPFQQRHGDDLGLVGRERPQTFDVDRRQLAVDLDLWRTSDRKVQVADVLGDAQHLLQNRRKVEVAHRCLPVVEGMPTRYHQTGI